MVVDDDPGVIFTVKQGLEGLDSDYQAITVNSGLQCLEKLEKEALPDLNTFRYYDA
jgi:CheY-like chemotaxis protein